VPQHGVSYGKQKPNAKCACGSDIKYKYCCKVKEREKAEAVREAQEEVTTVDPTKAALIMGMMAYIDGSMRELDDRAREKVEVDEHGYGEDVRAGFKGRRCVGGREAGRYGRRRVGP